MYEASEFDQRKRLLLSKYMNTTPRREVMLHTLVNSDHHFGETSRLKSTARRHIHQDGNLKRRLTGVPTTFYGSQLKTPEDACRRLLRLKSINVNNSSKYVHNVANSAVS
jgi:hypothetical protein